jgi:hypothetical protein
VVRRIWRAAHPLLLQSFMIDREGHHGLETARPQRSAYVGQLTVLGVVSLFLLSLSGGWIVLSQFRWRRGDRFRSARTHVSRTDARTVAGAAEMYVAQHSSRCPTLDDLRREGYLAASTHVEDAWDTPFRIACEGEEVVVSSAGPDGQHDTGDDVR